MIPTDTSRTPTLQAFHAILRPRRMAACIIATLLNLVVVTSATAQLRADGLRSSASNVLSAGVQVADETNGRFGAAISIERRLKRVGREFSLGAGIATGIRHSNFKGILGSDYSALFIPVSGILNVHYEPVAHPRLDVYAGPSGGVSIRRYRAKNCGGAANCDPDDASPMTVGLQVGARWALKSSLQLWTEAGTGRHGDSFALGVSRRF